MSLVVTAYHRRKLDALIREVNRLTAAHGAKASLARWLRVSPQQLNFWLSGEREPSGGVTLHLREWVDKMEQKQNTPASATNTHEGEQTRKGNREKSKTGPPRKQ